MRLLVVGAGAIGSLLGAALLRSGQEVQFVARGRQAEAIRQDGLRIEGKTEASLRPFVMTTISPGTGADAVLLTVKTFDLATASKMIGRGIAVPVPILAVQNGLGIEPIVADALRTNGWKTPELWLVRAVNSIPAALVAPGRVRHAGRGEILLPDPSGGGGSVHSTLFHRLLDGAGISVRLVDSIEREVWRKALINAAINPVTAAHGLLNGELLREPWASEARTLLREAQHAAHFAGFDFGDSEVDQDLDRILRATASNRSSMVQDLALGRPTEIDAISGAILREALRHGVNLPATERMIALIHEKARGTSTPSTH